ncbi:hypothetical protein BH11PSE13_BH11PSE13_35640 [soil metagenome]
MVSCKLLSGHEFYEFLTAHLPYRLLRLSKQPAPDLQAVAATSDSPFRVSLANLLPHPLNRRP